AVGGDGEFDVRLLHYCSRHALGTKKRASLAAHRSTAKDAQVARVDPAYLFCCLVMPAAKQQRTQHYARPVALPPCSARSSHPGSPPATPTRGRHCAPEASQQAA